MAATVGSNGDGDGSRLLLVESGERERSWRLNFDGFRRAELLEKKPPRWTHHCLSTLVKEDVVAEYYQQQVEMLDGFGEMDILTDRGFLPQMSKEERENIARSETLAIRISNAANIVLFVAKVYASVRSGSLAIIASTLDSLLDILSGFILWFTAFSMQTPNPYKYPIGKRRMQPLVVNSGKVIGSIKLYQGLYMLTSSSTSTSHMFSCGTCLSVSCESFIML